jgi:hypothetical protein
LSQNLSLKIPETILTNFFFVASSRNLEGRIGSIDAEDNSERTDDMTNYPTDVGADFFR